MYLGKTLMQKVIHLPDHKSTRLTYHDITTYTRKHKKMTKDEKLYFN